VRLLSEKSTACSMYIPAPQSSGMLPASLFEYSSRLLRSLAFTTVAGMLPVKLLLSRPLRSLAFTTVAGMLPVKLLLSSTKEYRKVLVGMTSGMVPVRLLLDKPIWDRVPGTLSRQLGRLPVKSMLLKSRYCSPFCISEPTMSSLSTDSRAPAAVSLCSRDSIHNTLHMLPLKPSCHLL
jgi:hypothetical protein